MSLNVAEKLDRMAESNARSRIKRKVASLKFNSEMRRRAYRKSFAEQVKRHMARGRDVSDIAIIMNIPVSHILVAVNSLKNPFRAKIEGIVP